MTHFITNIARLVSGSVLSQALGIVLIPIITRLYQPGDIGVLQVFISLSAILALFSTLSYHYAIMLPEKDDDSINIVALCILLLMINSIFVLMICIYNSEWLSQMINAPQIAEYMIFIPIAVFLNGLAMILNIWLARNEKFSLIAIAGITNSFTGRITQIVSGLIHASANGLILGVILGNIVTNLFMLRDLIKDYDLIRKVSYRDIAKLAMRYKRFPIFNLGSTTANEISRQSPIFMLSIFFNTSIVGYYSLAFQVVSLPMSFIGGAIAQVFYQKATEDKNKSGSISEIVGQFHWVLLSIGLFPMIVLFIIGDNIFQLVFGQSWSSSGTYARILVPWLFLMFISSPLSSVFYILEKQSIALAFDIILLASRILSLYLGGLYGDPYVAVILFSITGALANFIMNLAILSLSKVHILDEAVKICKLFMLAVTLSLPLVVEKIWMKEPFELLLAATGLTLIYYFIIAARDPLFRPYMTKYIIRIRACFS